MDDEQRLFEEAIAGVEPLADRDRQVPVRRPPASRRRRHGGKGAGRLEVERFGEQHEGVARKSERRALAELRRGKVPVDLRLDLHGMNADEGRSAVRDLLARAVAARAACVQIVHGRGRRSPDGPVLKAALPGWLAEPPHGHRVRAFTTAPPQLGGPGATLVLLSRRRVSS
jgi:DNA-nicking Smr family endonuclease